MTITSLTPRRARRLALVALTAPALLALSVIDPAPVAAATPRTPIWVGSAATSTWPDASGCPAAYPSDNCSLPASHHTFNWGNPYAGDVGWDQQNVASGANVAVYAAPQDGSLSSQITAKVEAVGLACKARTGETTAQTRARGGSYVKVGLYRGSTRSGTVTYVHVNPSVSVGQAVNRWGGVIGKVGDFTSNSCWTARHLHVELYNDANYACYNRSWKPGQQTAPSNFVGYVGGSFATAPRQGCP